ncbi:GNAT family N-acetyltransferase [Halovenus rubra]|uniref:GNAT family N-acetyltransferase n=2 Tax=Halovenus rubra TaxID=869890 RepID=A0ACC7DWU5_9EURY|nr:GNAT family N-acetyltransferase [Halovenus rubra]
MVEIRQGRPADHPTLRTIQKQTLAEPSPELLGTAVHGPPELLVADDGEPIGYTLFIAGNEEAILLEIAVAPPRQGNGIGSTLITETCLYLDELCIERVRLTAHAADDRAKQFYKRHGFESEDYLTGYFESGDAVLFSRDI